MALGTNFKGAKLNKLAINSKKYAVLACNASDYTRGSLFTDGSLLYLVGIVSESEYNRSPEKTFPIGSGEAVFSRKASFKVNILATIEEKALQELEDSKIVLFVVEQNELINLDGFTYTQADFTNIKGILNAEYIFYNVTPEIKYTAKGKDVTQFELNVNVNNKQTLTSQVFNDEPVGTYLAYWDWVAGSSLVDSVNSITLTAGGGASYSTDHYAVDGTSNEYLLNDNFAQYSPLDIGEKNTVCYYIDWLDNGTGSQSVIFTIGDGTLYFRLETKPSNNGIYASLRTDGGGIHGVIADYTYTSSSRKAVLVYLNLSKNIAKIIDSEGEQDRTRPVSLGLPDRIGGFDGADNDLYVGLTQAGSPGADVNVYKLGVSH